MFKNILLSVHLFVVIRNTLIKDKPLKPGSYRGRKNTAPEKEQKVNGENHA